jgi:hypothetical protein
MKQKVWHKAILAMMITSSLALLTASCGSLQRSGKSGYAFQDDTDNGRGRLDLEQDAAMREMGFNDDHSLSGRDQDAISFHILLTKAEKALEGKREREQYFKSKSHMKDDRERLGFLRLKTYEEKEKWLIAHGIQGTTAAHPPEIQALVDVNDITLGMTRQAVRESWGAPEAVEVAGNPIYGNERWNYSEQVASQDGFRTEKRTVFFDSGRVSGWETR